MSKTTYYIVQTGERKSVMLFVNNWVRTTRNPNMALRFATYGKAHEAFRIACEMCGRGTPRRFPRIVKVTIETKTVKDRR